MSRTSGQRPRPVGRSLTRAELADAAIFAGCLLALVSIALFIDRGLDLTDEGLYLLSAAFPEDVRASTSDYHYYVGLLYRLSGESVTGLRICGLGLLLMSALVAAWGLATAFREIGLLPGAVLSPYGRAAFLALGALLYYTWVPPTPSYNLLTSCAAYVAFGLVLRGLGQCSVAPPQPKWVAAPFLGVGAATGAALFVKFPAGIAILGLSGATILLWPLSSPGAKRRALGTLVIGLACWMSLRFVVVSSPEEWWRHFRLGLELLRIGDSAHEPITALLGYGSRAYVVTWRLICWTLWPAVPPLVVGLLALRAADGPTATARPVRRAALAALVCAFAIGAWRVAERGWHLGGHDSTSTLYAPYLAVAIGLGLTLLAVARDSRGGIRGLGRVESKAAIILLIAAAGFTIGPAVGTNNTIDAVAVLTMTPFFAAVLLLVELACRQSLPRWLGGGILVGVATLATIQVSTARIRSPYGLSSGVLEQTLPVDVGGRGDHVRVDLRTAEFLRRASTALAACGFAVGGDVLPLAKVPGLVFALGGRSPVTSWYSAGTTPKAVRQNARIISLIEPERLRHAFLLLTPAQGSSRSTLEKLGIRLGAGYDICSQLTSPVTGRLVQIWSPSRHSP